MPVTPIVKVVPQVLAWVKFNGTTGAVASSFNVAGVSRASAGAFTVNFLNTLTASVYSVAATPEGAGWWITVGTQSASSCGLNFWVGGTPQDITGQVYAVFIG